MLRKKKKPKTLNRNKANVYTVRIALKIGMPPVCFGSCYVTKSLDLTRNRFVLLDLRTLPFFYRPK